MSEQENAQTLDRDTLRSMVLGSPCVARAKVIEYQGARFELRRATLAQQSRLTKIAKTRSGEQDDVKLLVHTIIECCYVPGTKQKLFAASDEGALLEMDTGPGSLIAEFMKAAKELAADEADIEKNSETAPTDS